MGHKNYLITYTVKSKSGSILRDRKKIKVKNRVNDFDAQVKLEGFMKKKHPDFGLLIVHDCKEENPFNNMFGDSFNNMFGGNDIFDIFKKK